MFVILRERERMSQTQCAIDSSGREKGCSSTVSDWHDEAFEILSLALHPSVPFLIDIKNICDTKKQCGCFLRGPVSRYVPTCSNALISIDSVSLVVLVNSGTLHSKYDTKLFPISTVFSRGAVIRQQGDSYCIESVSDPSKKLEGISKQDAVGIFDYIVREMDGVVGYEFVTAVSIPDSKAYSDLLDRMVMPNGNPACKGSGKESCRLDIDPSDPSPFWDLHVTLDDRLVWHIAESCSIDFVGPQRAVIKVAVLSSNVPPFVL